MKKTSILLASFLFLNAQDIHSLFDAIKNIPESKIDNLKIKETQITKKSITYSLYPQVTLFANAEHYNTYFSIRPLTPTESAKLIQTNSSIPFSQNIIRIGAEFSMPLFIKSIYDNKEKMSHIINAAKYKVKLNLLQREATLVVLLSNYNYLVSLKKALLTQKNSIKKTIEAIKVGVEVGRIPEFKLLRLKDAINQIDINIDQIDTNIAKTKSQIYTLTKQKLTQPVNFEAYNVTIGDYLATKPIKENIKASKLDIKAKKDDFYPKVMLKVNANRGFGWAYNTKDSVALNTATAGIYVSWNIFNKKTSSEVQKSKVQYMQNQLELQKTIKDLDAEVEKINKSLKIINKSLLSAKRSIEIKKELLKSAKVAFKLNTMTVDEYLKYEDDLAKAKATLANLIASKNSLIAQKALIYGNNFKKVFK